MTIIDRLLLESTYEQRVERPVKLQIEYAEEESIKRYDSFAMQTKYVLQAKLFVEFWANPAQLREAKNRAERVILSHLYVDALRKIDTAIHAIYNDDKDIALEALENLRKEIIG